MDIGNHIEAHQRKSGRWKVILESEVGRYKRLKSDQGALKRSLSVP